MLERFLRDSILFFLQKNVFRRRIFFFDVFSSMCKTSSKYTKVGKNTVSLVRVALHQLKTDQYWNMDAFEYGKSSRVNNNPEMYRKWLSLQLSVSYISKLIIEETWRPKDPSYLLNHLRVLIFPQTVLILACYCPK